jgi:hypothetical protein
VNEVQRHDSAPRLYWQRSPEPPSRSLAHHAEEVAMQTIVVPLDGSAVAEQVLPSAQRLAWILGARLHLLLVITDAHKQQLIAHFAAAAPRATGRYETDWHWERRASC